MSRMFFKKLKNVSCDGWLKTNFESCVIRETRSLGVFVLLIYSICDEVAVTAKKHHMQDMKAHHLEYIYTYCTCKCWDGL